MPRLRKTAFVLLVGGVTGATVVFGQSGTFTFVTGDVKVQRRDGSPVPVTRGSAVRPGDSIVTGERAMAQLTMVDQAKISLRPNTQFQIEQYADRPDSDQGALLNLVRGTLRTFTGLIAARSRDRFMMKTKVATVGIRGSGNVLFAGTAADCDPAKAESGGSCDITVNHTIEGSHAVTFGDFSAPGLPPQQGGAQTLITGPGQTVLVTARGDVRYIPTPQFISDTANNPTGAPKSSATGQGSGSGEEARNFAPNDASGATTQQGTTTPMPVGNNGLGFTFVDAATNLVADPVGLQDLVISSSGTPVSGQATAGDVVSDGTSLRSYRSYAGTLSTAAPTFTAGTARDTRAVSTGSTVITLGRWENVSFGYFGAGSAAPVAGSAHWIYAASGFPAYLSDVLTGTASYTLAAATSPTNQAGTAGTLGSASLAVNFTNRTLDAALGLTMPATGGNPGGTWTLNAQGVPIALNGFYASTSDRLVVRNTGTGQNSATNGSLSGSLEGGLVGSRLEGAIVGYGVVDQTAASPAAHNVISGVAAFTGDPQSAAAQYRDGLVSDPSQSLVTSTSLLRTYATIDRPAELTADPATGALTAFAAPYNRLGDHATYSRGTASALNVGADPDTGMIWGRWSGGEATVSRDGQNASLNLTTSSLHYIFSGPQSGPVALPLTGTATYDVIGSTPPTDNGGHVGALNTASLNANFTNRTVEAAVNITVNGQTLNGVTNAMPIYREQYFSAYTANPGAGLITPSQLTLTCNPSCGPQPTGSLDGFFAGRSGSRAGVNYNFNGNAGAIAFGRRGG